MTIRFACLLLILLTSALRAETIDIVWTPDGRFGYEALLAAAAVDEICGALTEGDTVEWTLKAKSPIDFNIHYHQGDEVVYPVKQDGASNLQQRLAVPASQTYCWMLTNPASAAAVVELDLEHNPD